MAKRNGAVLYRKWFLLKSVFHKKGEKVRGWWSLVGCVWWGRGAYLENSTTSCRVRATSFPERSQIEPALSAYPPCVAVDMAS